MAAAIDQHIERFERFANDHSVALGSDITIERICDYGWLLTPRRNRISLPRNKTIGLTLMGITHGNEWSGAAVINETLSHIAAGSINLDIPVAFILGNPWAALQNKRFLERDLNRSFARAQAVSLEERRAAELMGVLGRTAFILDFHQTIRHTDRPFFIFPYNSCSLNFARQILPQLTVVTHWGKPFSAEGMCTDEFVISQGGTGVSLELGQNGFDTYQIAVGVEAALWAIRVAAMNCSGDIEALRRRAVSCAPDLYTWASILPWPERGYVELIDGLDNFRDVHLGEQLGRIQDQPLLATVAGKLLFPKYLSKEQQALQTTRPTEILRIVKPIELTDLPHG